MGIRFPLLNKRALQLYSQCINYTRFAKKVFDLTSCTHVLPNVLCSICVLVMMMSLSALGPCMCSFYIGQRPMVMVADLDMVKQITVVEFGHFMDREVSSTGGVGDTPLHVFSHKASGGPGAYMCRERASNTFT